MRKGLQFVKVLGNSVLDLLVKWPTLKERLFPRKSKPFINLPALASTILYDLGNDPLGKATKQFFGNFLEELSKRHAM
jgi:hypothetical protein